MNREAIVFGATGLVGSHLLQILLEDPNYSVVKVLTRKTVGFEHKKLEEHLVNLKELDNCDRIITGDDIFICLGTTLKKAKTQKRFFEVDYFFPKWIAKIASRNGVRTCSVVSSIGADKDSRSFYMKTKGKMETKIGGYAFGHLRFYRPSLILGKRGEARLKESISAVFMQFFKFILVGKFKKYRAIQAQTIARAMVNGVVYECKVGVFESDEIKELANAH